MKPTFMWYRVYGFAQNSYFDMYTLASNQKKAINHIYLFGGNEVHSVVIVQCTIDRLKVWESWGISQIHLFRTRMQRKKKGKKRSTQESADVPILHIKRICPEKNQLNFMDLGYDCLLELCDYMDIEALTIIAGTSKAMQEIARKSFELKGIIECFYNREKESRGRCKRREPLYVKNRYVVANVIRHFGDFLRSLSFYVSSDSQRTCNNLVAMCNGTVQKLGIHSNLDSHKLKVNLKSLFKQLTALSITMSSFDLLRYPFQECSQLQLLQIRDCDEKLLQRCFSTVFPALTQLDISQMYMPQRLFNKFLSKHPDITDLMVLSLKVNLDAILHLTKLTNLYLRFSDLDKLAVCSRMTLKYLRVGRMEIIEVFLILLQDSPILRMTLERFSADLPTAQDDDQTELMWFLFSDFKKLHGLKLTFYCSFPPNKIIAAMTQLVGQLPKIEVIVVTCAVGRHTVPFDTERPVPKGNISVFQANPDQDRHYQVRFYKNESTLNEYVSAWERDSLFNWAAFCFFFSFIYDDKQTNNFIYVPYDSHSPG